MSAWQALVWDCNRKHKAGRHRPDAERAHNLRIASQSGFSLLIPRSFFLAQPAHRGFWEKHNPRLYTNAGTAW
jgi:hypothetical protein